jgi:hypothetical protein
MVNAPSSDLISNIGYSQERFDQPIGDLDFFEITGLPSYPFSSRYKTAGVIRYKLEREVGGNLAEFYKASSETFIIGEARHPGVVGNKLNIDGCDIIYLGKSECPATEEGMRALTSLLNNKKEAELRKNFFSTGPHLFYEKKYTLVKNQYHSRDLLLFRGISFRYNFLKNGTLIVSLDTHTHYVDSRSLLDEINIEKSTDFLVKELSSREAKLKSSRRKSNGLRFHYALASMPVNIVKVGTRKISEEKLQSPIKYNGNEYSNLPSYLINRYPSAFKEQKMDNNQIVVYDKNGYGYPPQFLHRNIQADSIPAHIKNREMYLASGDERKGWDHQIAALNRWNLIKRYYENFGFGQISIGKMSFHFKLNKSTNSGYFNRPKLELSMGNVSSQSELLNSLRNGFYKPPNIKNFCIYYGGRDELAKKVYEILKEEAYSKYKVVLPDKHYPVPQNLEEVENSLQEVKRSSGTGVTFLLSIVPPNSGLHDKLINASSRSETPTKSITTDSCYKILTGKHGSKSILLNTLFSIFVRAGAIPWVISSRLNYSGYMFVDVGRSTNEYWTTGCVIKKDGEFKIWPGNQIVGEDLDDGNINQVLDFAIHNELDTDNLIYVRDGEISLAELNSINKVLEQRKEIKNFSIVSYKKNVPYRIFRIRDGVIQKSRSGDYLRLTEDNYIVCNSGADFSHQGTPTAKATDIRHIKGKLNTEWIIEDLFKMCFLNWGSPKSPYSDPAPLHMIDDYLKELTRGVHRKRAPF